MTLDQSRQEERPSGLWQGEIDRRRFLVASAGLMSLGGLLAACGGSSGGSGGGEGGDVTFGFSHPYAELPIVAAIKKSVQSNGEAEGWKVLLDETKAGNIQEQTATIETWITQKVTAISMFPPEPSAFEAMAKRAVDSGIIWTTYAEEMDQGAGGVLFPDTLSGQATGKATVDWINANDPEAEVLILVPETTTLSGRTKIPEQMIKELTKATIVAEQVALEQAKGLQVTESTLQAHPNVSVVVGVTDDAALGAAEAFHKAGKADPSKVWIIGQDGSEEGLVALKEPGGYFSASAALDIAKLCEEVAGVAKRAIDGGWQPGDKQEYVKFPPTLIERADTKLIDRFLAAYQ